MSKTAVVSISSRIPTEPYYFYHAFLRSCQQHGINPIFLEGGVYKGLLTKPKWLLAWLEFNALNYEHVIFSDAWDVLFGAGTDEIIEKFKGFNAPIVFNAERTCFPRGDLADKFPESPTAYRFLNSGFIVATSEAMLAMLRDMRLEHLADDYQKPDGSWHNPNDQENYGVWFLNNPGKAALDYRATICQTLHGVPMGELVVDEGTGRVKSELTGSQPSVFHGNGGGKDYLKKIMAWLRV